jgi:hypothetical protein
MESQISLSGLERLLTICRQLGLSTQLEPPISPALTAGGLVAGLPADPLLAAVHERVGYIAIKDEFFLLRIKDEQNFDIARVNEGWRRDWAEPFRSLLVFAKEDRLAYYYAMVPKLTTEKRLQPVVKVDVHEDLYALPVASDMDRFFDVYSHYLEALVKAPYYEEDGASALVFPWQVPELIGRDKPLVEMLRAGRFDFLMERNADAQAWANEVLRIGG